MPAVDLQMEALERSASRRKTFYRWLLFLILGVFAIYYLAPMYVMIVTSFKSMEEIRKGNLMMLPKEFLLDAWKIAWGGRGYDAGDVFLRPFFWNSTKMVVPAVVISTFLGAINGYILTKWRFKGDNIIFLLFLFGCFFWSFLFWTAFSCWVFYPLPGNSTADGPDPWCTWNF